MPKRHIKTISNSLYMKASRISAFLFCASCHGSFDLLWAVIDGLNPLAHIEIKTKELWIFTFKGLFYEHWTWRINSQYSDQASALDDRGYIHDRDKIFLPGGSSLSRAWYPVTNMLSDRKAGLKIASTSSPIG